MVKDEHTTTTRTAKNTYKYRDVEEKELELLFTAKFLFPASVGVTEKEVADICSLQIWMTRRWLKSFGCNQRCTQVIYAELLTGERIAPIIDGPGDCLAMSLLHLSYICRAKRMST